MLARLIGEGRPWTQDAQWTNQHQAEVDRQRSVRADSDREKVSGAGANLNGSENIDHLLDHVSTPDFLGHAQFVTPLLRDVRQR